MKNEKESFSQLKKGMEKVRSANYLFKIVDVYFKKIVATNGFSSSCDCFCFIPDEILAALFH